MQLNRAQRRQQARDTRRGKVRQQAARPAVLQHVLAARAGRSADKPTPGTQAEAEMAGYRSALLEITQGKTPGLAEWNLLSRAVNTVWTLALRGNVPAEEVEGDVVRAMGGLVKASERFAAGKGMRLDAACLAALRAILDVCELALAGLSELEMASVKVQTDVRAAEATAEFLASQCEPGDRVMVAGELA